MKVPNWDDYFMTMAYLAASKSKDERTHYGAVVVGPDNEIRSVGYNSFPRGIDDGVSERQIAPEKYYWIEHSERNAIYNATLIGTSLKNCRMYTTTIPCTGCGGAVIQSGIKEVIVDGNWKVFSSHEKWQIEEKKTLEMFAEAGIKVKKWKGDFVDIVKFGRGEIIK